MTTTKSLTGLWANLSRAYEIALLGNLTIQIVFDKDYTQGFEDYHMIKQFFTGVTFAKDGDLIVEIYKPDYNQIDIDGWETLEAIQQRVKDIQKTKQPDNTIDKVCQHILKVGSEHLAISLQSRESILHIGSVIAWLDKSEAIRPEHIAEAIQYKALMRKGCNAEENTISFGKGITVALYELSFDDIHKAIKYLNTLI